MEDSREERERAAEKTRTGRKIGRGAVAHHRIHVRHRPGYAADLISLDAGDLGGDLPEVVRAAGALGVGTTDALRDRRCLFVHGAAPPPEQRRPLPPGEEAVREACRARGPFTTLAMSLAEQHESAVHVRAVQLTTSRYAVHEYTLTRTPDGEWAVAAVETLVDVRS